jgi:hypothetical protein
MPALPPPELRGRLKKVESLGASQNLRAQQRQTERRRRRIESIVEASNIPIRPLSALFEFAVAARGLGCGSEAGGSDRVRMARNRCSLNALFANWVVNMIPSFSRSSWRSDSGQCASDPSKVS